MIVCHCHALSDRDIRRAVRAGATTPGQVGVRCGAATECGGCFDLVCELVREEQPLGRLPIVDVEAPPESTRVAV